MERRGIIALTVAVYHPERAGKVFAFGANSNPDALIDAPPNAQSREFFREMEREYRELSPTPNDFAKLVREMATWPPLHRTLSRHS